MTFASDRILAMERLAVAAWPATETDDVTGWLWRWSGGGSQRANSVSTLAWRGPPGAAALDAAIDSVEQRYRAKGQLSRFQLCDLTKPDGLEERLIARGYQNGEACALLAKPLVRSAEERDGKASAWLRAGRSVATSADPDEAWLETYLAVQSESRRAVNRVICGRVPAPRAFVSATADGGTVAATGLGVVADGNVIVECMTTAATHRRQSAARAVLDAIEAWALAEGARVACLQVVRENHPARALYAGFGMQPIGGNSYWQRELD